MNNVNFKNCIFLKEIIYFTFKDTFNVTMYYDTCEIKIWNNFFKIASFKCILEMNTNFVGLSYKTAVSSKYLEILTLINGW